AGLRPGTHPRWCRALRPVPHRGRAGSDADRTRGSPGYRRLPQGHQGTRSTARPPGGGEGGPGGAEEGARGGQARAGGGDARPRAGEEVVAQARTWSAQARTAGREPRRQATSACHRWAPGHDEGAQDALLRPFVDGGSAAAESHLATAFFRAEPADTLTP